MKCLLALQNVAIAQKWEHSFSILKAFFVQHLLEYEMSDNDLKVNPNI